MYIDIILKLAIIRIDFLNIKMRFPMSNEQRKSFPFRMPLKIHQLLTLKAIQENTHMNEIILNAVEKELKNFTFNLDIK